jgi:ABC-type Fe3+ transport system substrate-binding protein
MSDRWTKIIVVALLVIVVGVPFLLRPRGSAAPAPAPGSAPGSAPSNAQEQDLTLVIITPHNEQIRHEISRAFNQQRAALHLPQVNFDWRASGGTSDLRKQVLAQLEAAANAGREEEGIAYDLFFGGGDYEHNKLAQGVTITRNGEKLKISASVPVPIPDDLMRAAFPQPMIGGERLYHPDRQWIGVVLSSFGIVYNRDVLHALHLSEPATWADLAAPPYRGWIALADPGHSGSIASTYHAILRRLGWTEGWKLLRRTFANARYFTASSAKVPVDVSAGEAAAGMCIDFYGRFQAGAIAAAQASLKSSDAKSAASHDNFPEGRVGYVDPVRMTAITADPISLIRGAPHRDLAIQFIHWLLSTEAQRLWQRKLGQPDGPEKFELRRLPIRRDLYTDSEMAHWVDRVNPYDAAAPFPKAMPDFYSTVGPLAHAMAIDLHEELTAAWTALNTLAPDDPRHSQALELFDAMPPELTLHWPDDELAQHWSTIIDDPKHPRYEQTAATLADFRKGVMKNFADADTLQTKRLQWTAFFRANYERIVDLAAD